MSSKTVISVPPWLLHQFLRLLVLALTSYTGFTQGWVWGKYCQMKQSLSSPSFIQSWCFNTKEKLFGHLFFSFQKINYVVVLFIPLVLIPDLIFISLHLLFWYLDLFLVFHNFWVYNSVIKLRCFTCSSDFYLRTAFTVFHRIFYAVFNFD